MIVVALAGAALAHGLHWEGRATVHAGGRTIAIAVRTTIARDGSVVGDSWPVAEGEAKGLRRMIINADGGWLERGGKRAPLPAAIVAEERLQYGFYAQLQDAARWCRRNPARRGPFVAKGAVTTSFSCRRGAVAEAQNRLAPDIVQRFVLSGWWRDRGMAFPRRMDIIRGGKPYFTLDVTRFDAR